MTRSNKNWLPRLLILLLGIAAFAGSPALAAEEGKPWFHVTAVPYPSAFHAGAARDQVDELKVTATEGDVLWIEPVSLEEFHQGKISFAELKFAVFSYNASHEAVQTALVGAYGAGNVEVAGGCTETVPPLSECLYTITFKGGLGGRPVAAPPAEFFPDAGIFGATKLEGEASVAEKTKGRPDGELMVIASNLGDAAANGETEPITVSAVLPAGVEAVAVTGRTLEGKSGEALACSLSGENGVPGPACSFTHPLFPYMSLTMRVAIDDRGASGSISDTASASGGGARPVSAPHPLPLGESAPFGLAAYELVNEEEGGALDTQAGSHPFQQTTTVLLNASVDPTHQTGNYPNGYVEPAQQPKDLHLSWPAGLIGDPASLPQCPVVDFLVEKCPADTAVGVARSLASVNQGEGNLVPTLVIQPIFNLVPSPGEPARFAFLTAAGPVYVDPSVRSGRDYGITINVNNITQKAGVLYSEVTVWGAPADPRHDGSRGYRCDAASENFQTCAEPAGMAPAAFLSLPTSCTGPLASVVTGDSWAEPKPAASQQLLAEYHMPALDGCASLPFNPEIKVAPDVPEASKPTGLNVDVHVPQQETLNPDGLAVADPRSITVTLPEGVAANPSSGDGLGACSEGLVGFEGLDEKLNPGSSTATFKPFLPGSIAAMNAIEEGVAPAAEGALAPGVNFCADASKIGEVTIKTPLLPPTQPLKGSVYLASQNENPFGSLIAMYIVAEDPVSGTLVKLAGQVHLDLATGQLTTTFENSPQAAFEDAELHFFGGERAPLATPAHCGAYTTIAQFKPWSAEPGEPAHIASSTFNIESGPNHTPCPPASLPFSPSLHAGVSNINAGSFTPLSTTIQRSDGEHNLASVQLHMPAGLEGLLSNVKLCPEAHANEGTCGPESLIGETTVSAGVGSDPVSVKGGRVYITEKYAGAPFGLSIVNPVKAGPFDLEHDTSNPAQNPPCDCVIVRAKVAVNPTTAELTVTTDKEGPHAIPHLIDGIPIQIKAVNVTVSREHFTFNPTNCNPLSLTGMIASDEGASSPVSVPFQATNCAVLKYEPKVSVTTAAKASKVNGASLHFRIAYPRNAMGTQSWFNEAKFDIPRQLPARLTTIQKACLAATFEHNRSACPPASIIGHAVVHTPVLPVPLEGPVYFVSYGGAAFPDAVLVLDGYGVHIELHGNTFINGKTGVTSATFKNTPDVPFESIEVSIPTGPFSEFGANLPASAHGSFCGQKLVMPTLLKAQNGLEIHQNTPVGVTGCGRALTRKQKLAAALRACHKKHGKRRAACEKAARKAFGARATKHRKGHS